MRHHANESLGVKHLSENSLPTQHHPDQVEAFDPEEVRPDTAAAAEELAAAGPGAIIGVTADRLRGFFERVERLEEERKAIGEDINEIFSEAKSLGFDVPIMRAVIALRKMETQARLEREELIDVYKHAVGMD